MNERIFKLVGQARKYAWENETHWSANAEREALFEQKFAELIVKECGKVAWRHTPETEDLEYSHLIKDKILEHFGVEE